MPEIAQSGSSVEGSCLAEAGIGVAQPGDVPSSKVLSLPETHILAPRRRNRASA